ncbi:MAG: nuclear transport factor 2 family protein [Ilumatobacteraceae bacterium]
MTDLEIRTTIDDALKSYCRGIDRLHGPSVAAAFHPGAVLVDYGPSAMTIEQFVEHALGSLQRKFTSTTHRLSNVSIELRGDWALVESYTLAHHVEEAPEGRRLHVFGGRYIDRFEDRDGVWKIAQRTLRNDWSHVEAMGEPMSGSYVASGRAGTPDPIFD